jgi:alpha-beta hydrolase superfamily lysophospholipase
MGTSPSLSVSTRSFTSADGTPLRADYYTDVDKPCPLRGVVVVIHGYCDHRGRYLHVADHLVQHGYSVLVGDLRGHGESGGERGFVRRFGDYLDDMSAFLVEAKVQLDLARTARPAVSPPERPIILGHSMGGLVALEYLLAHPEVARAIALSSPFFGVKQHVPAWKRALGLAASLANPTLRMPNGLDSNDVSHDPEVRKSYATDPLVTHEATARWFTETMAAQADVRVRAGRIRTPMLMLHAGDDRIVDAAASQAVFSRIGASDKTLTFYPGLYHEIFNELEPDRKRVLEDLTNWLRDH